MQVAKNHADTIKTRVDVIRVHIEMMQQMESVYVGKMGQDKYDNMIVSLMNQMPGMETTVDIATTAALSAIEELPDSGVLPSMMELPFYYLGF